MCCRNTLITFVSAWLGHKQTQHTDHISIFGFWIVRVLSFWFFQGQDMRKKSLLKHQPRLDEAFFSVWQGAGPGHGILPDCQGMVKRMREAYPTIYTYFPCVHACIHPSMFISLSNLVYMQYISYLLFYYILYSYWYDVLCLSARMKPSNPGRFPSKHHHLQGIWRMSEWFGSTWSQQFNIFHTSWESLHTQLIVSEKDDLHGSTWCIHSLLPV